MRASPHLDAVLARRRTRLGEIGERLEKRARLPGRELAARAASVTAPTRLHLARALVARGHARDTQEAFDRWLNRDKAGHVPAGMARLRGGHVRVARQRRRRRYSRIRIAIGCPRAGCGS